MALQLTAAGTPVSVAIESISYEKKVDDPATCTFDVPDTVGYALTQNQVVQVTDTVTSTTLYTGFIDSVADVAYPGNLGIKTRSVTCKDNRWRVEKRIWTGQEFPGWTAGDIAAKMHQAVLASEGIVAAYALRHDVDNATFGQGTLAGTVASGNTLTLASAGSDFTKTEAVTADFATGTLTNVVAANNALQLTSYKAIKYSGTAGANLDNNNLYALRKIWAGSYTLVSGDKILYDLWIDSRSPEIKIGLDFQFSDGTWMHDAGIYTDFQDQEVIPLAPATDLSGWADDQWYSRTCIVPPAQAGKVIVAIYLDIEGEKGGNYVGYFKNIRITNASNVVQRTIFATNATAMSANVRASSNGYFNLSASVVTVYADTGTRISPSRSITGVGIVKGSVISWTELDAAQPTTGASTQYPPQVLIEASYDDGATYQTCINHAPLPGLIIGMNTNARNIILRQTLAVGGPNPEMAPILDTCSFTVSSAAAATKTDFVDIRGTQALLNSGTLSNATSYSDGIKTTGQYRNWDNLDISSQTLWGLSGAGNPQQGAQTGYFFLRTDGGLDCRSQFNFAGQWANFIAEIDIHIVSSGSGNEYELVYRTTGWNNNNNTYAYVAGLTASTVTLRRAANGGTPAFTTISNISLSLTVGNWYRLKVVANGSSHQVYVNDVLFINVTDATYTAAGYLGVRFWNGSGVRDSGHYDNFGVVGYEADLISVSSWTTPALALSGIVGDSRLNWNASILSSSGLVVESTLDNGITWATCTNGAQVPFLVNGFNAAGKSLKIRYSMTNQSVNLPIAILGHSVFVTGQYSASGTRISPALDISPAGTIGSSSMTWTASQPTGTGVAIAGSTDNITYTPIASSGSPIPGLVAQGNMMADDFDSNSAANYTATFWAGGTVPVFTIDTANSRMQVTSGTNGILIWTTFGTAQDVYTELISDQCDNAGLIFRYIDINNLYYVTYRDGSASTNPNTVAIRKRVASTDTQLVAPVALPGSFTRGTYHTLKVTMIGSVLTCYFDGIQAAQVSDTSLAAAGYVGIRQNSAVTSDWYSLRAQQLGASATGKNVYNKTTLTSTNPAVKPVVSELVMSVRGPDLMTGALLPSTQYAYKKISDNIKDAASKSKYSWRVDENLKLIVRDRAYTPAPWPLYSFDPALKGPISMPKLTRQSPLYCNRQYVTGAIDLQTFPEGKVGDGTTQSWGLSYPIDSISSITLDGNPQTFGVQGVDTGKAFYYQPGQNALSTDSTLFPEQDAQIAVIYVGQVPYTSMRENTAQQAALALIDSTTGIVEASEDCGGLPAAAADAIAQARIDERAILSMDWEYTTERGGLAPGQLQTIFVPEYGIVDTDVLITDIKTNLWADSNGTLNYLHDVTTTSGPNLGSWERIFALAAA
jgi:hypothetical protein